MDQDGKSNGQQPPATQPSAPTFDAATEAKIAGASRSELEFQLRHAMAASAQMRMVANQEAQQRATFVRICGALVQRYGRGLLGPDARAATSSVSIDKSDLDALPPDFTVKSEPGPNGGLVVHLVRAASVATPDGSTRIVS